MTQVLLEHNEVVDRHCQPLTPVPALTCKSPSLAPDYHRHRHRFHWYHPLNHARTLLYISTRHHYHTLTQGIFHFKNNSTYLFPHAPPGYAFRCCKALCRVRADLESPMSCSEATPLTLAETTGRHKSYTECVSRCLLLYFEALFLIELYPIRLSEYIEYVICLFRIVDRSSRCPLRNR